MLNLMIADMTGGEDPSSLAGVLLVEIDQTGRASEVIAWLSALLLPAVAE